MLKSRRSSVAYDKGKWGHKFFLFFSPRRYVLFYSFLCMCVTYTNVNGTVQLRENTGGNKSRPSHERDVFAAHCFIALVVLRRLASAFRGPQGPPAPCRHAKSAEIAGLVATTRNTPNSRPCQPVCLFEVKRPPKSTSVRNSTRANSCGVDSADGAGLTQRHHRV